MPRIVVGLDFGTLSARCLTLDLDTGLAESFEHVYEHELIEYPGEPAVARQDANDYLIALQSLLPRAGSVGEVIAIGTAATASTPIPVLPDFAPLSRAIPTNRDALAWVWKDHSSQAEADEITRLFLSIDPDRIARVGAYNAEWFWAKLLSCARRSPEVFATAHTWLEQCDFLTANLTGTVRRGMCAAGHKALYADGYPSADILGRLDDSLGKFARRLGTALPCSDRSGGLTAAWVSKTGIARDTPVAVGGVDAHLGAVGAGVDHGTVCLVLGTSACHLAVVPEAHRRLTALGISGVAADSVIPGMWGLEAGQAAFGDLLEWAVRLSGKSHRELRDSAARVPPGSQGVMVVDFHSGNRCPFTDADLTGAVVGLTMMSSQAHLYRACIEALSYGIRQILENFESTGVTVERLVACGGVAVQNPLVLQTIADVTRKRVDLAGSEETCALGAAIFGAVSAGLFPNTKAAQEALIPRSTVSYSPQYVDYEKFYRIWLDAQKHFAVEWAVPKVLSNLSSRGA